MTSPHLSQMEKAKRFRELHNREEAFLIPNPWDAGSAKILESIGFQALATTSAGLAWSLGEQDAETSKDHILAHCRDLSVQTSLPLSADLGIGFGLDPSAVADTISLVAETGAVGCSIEDTSALDGKQIDRSLAVERISAAVEAARNLKHDFVLTARTEGFVYGGTDFDETLARLQAFQEAGADVLYAPGIVDLALIKRLCQETDKPINVLTGFRGMEISFDELAEAGVRRISVGSQLARIAYGALVQSAEELFKNKAVSTTDIEVRSSAIARHIANASSTK